MFTLRAARLAAILSLIALFAGCRTRPATLNAWQDRVQSYVVEQGNGDMNNLREAHLTPEQPGFRIFSNDDVQQSTDFTGVLVGVHQSPQRAWYVYVLGEVQKQELASTRLAALTQSDGQFTWRMGDDDRAATATYRQQHEQAWMQRTGATSPPRGAMAFPSPGDQFELQSSGDTITVRERGSGAQWMVDLAAVTR